MANLKRGQKLACSPCGREVVVSSAGIARTTLWCCGRPMAKGSGAGKKASKKKK